MKKIALILFIVFIVGGGYFFYQQGFFKKKGPDNLPTAQELKRIEEIEQSSSQIAPNAVPGAGVRPVGSLPKPEPLPEATTTASTSTPQEGDEEVEEILE